MSTNDSTHLGTKKAKLSQAWLINLFLLGTFAISWAIPTHLELLPAAVRTTLPFAVGNYIGKKDNDISAERKILSNDATILKSNYSNGQGNFIQVSLVISGQDINNSIHRPERCLPSQGHRDLQHTSQALDLANGQTLPISHLLSKRDILVEGKKTTVNYHTIYWFIGHDTVTSSHYKRSLTDIRDRLVSGSAQQWAYINISIPSLSDNTTQASEHLQEFAKLLAPLLTESKALNH